MRYELLWQCIKSNVYESFYIFTLTKISPRHYSFFHYALNIILSFIARHEKPYIALRHNIGIIITVRFSCFTITSWFTWWHLEWKQHVKEIHRERKTHDEVLMRRKIMMVLRAKVFWSIMITLNVLTSFILRCLVTYSIE